MSLSDPLADMLTRMRNAVAVGHKKVSMPSSKLKGEVARVMKTEGCDKKWLNMFRSLILDGRIYLFLKLVF